MSVAWLAALVAPADVGPHPNFPITVHQPHTVLARLVSEHPLFGEDLEAISEHPLATLVRNAVDALRGKMDALDKLAADALNSSIPADARAAAALLASVFLSYDDRPDTAIETLRLLDDELAQITDSADVLLARALLNQQQALRHHELGNGGRDFAQRALEQCNAVDIDRITPFELNPGVSWDYRRTCQQMIDRISAVARAHIDLVDNRIMDIVRSDAPALHLKNSRRAYGGLRALLEDQFTTSYRRNKTTLRNSDPPDDYVWSAGLHAEIIGSVSETRSFRRDLAMLRAIRPKPRRGEETILRLFRRSGDRIRLRAMLAWMRAEGPLELLHAEAAHILRRRRRSLDELDLQVLLAASTLLTSEEATTAYGAACELAFDADGAVEGDSFERHMEAVKLAAALAPAANRIDDFAMALLWLIDGRRPTTSVGQEAVLDAIEDLDWTAVASGPKAEWTRWVEGMETAEAGDWRRIARTTAGVQLGLIDKWRPDDGLSAVGFGALLLNATGESRSATADGPMAALAAPIADVLSAIRQTASRGGYSQGRFAAAHVAAGLAVYGGVRQLWEPLVELLVDPLVYGPDKHHAFDLLTANVERIPNETIVRLREDPSRFLSARFPRFGDDANPTGPFLPAMRCSVALGIISPDRLVAELSRLACDPNIDVRAEVARSLHVLYASSKARRLVTISLGIQLSHDGSALVRSEAARFLGAIDPGRGAAADLVSNRVAELLKQDGLLVPVMALRGLGQRVSPIRNRTLRELIVHLSTNHAARGVRLLAQAVGGRM